MSDVTTPCVRRDGLHGLRASPSPDRLGIWVRMAVPWPTPPQQINFGPFHDNLNLLPLASLHTHGQSKPSPPGHQPPSPTHDAPPPPQHRDPPHHNPHPPPPHNLTPNNPHKPNDTRPSTGIDPPAPPRRRHVSDAPHGVPPLRAPARVHARARLPARERGHAAERERPPGRVLRGRRGRVLVRDHGLRRDERGGAVEGDGCARPGGPRGAGVGGGEVVRGVGRSMRGGEGIFLLVPVVSSVAVAWEMSVGG